jgi:hypothetical protein
LDAAERQWVAMSEEKRQMPPWLLGMILAAVVFVIGILVFKLLGFGDDPVVGDSMAMLVGL